MLQMNLRSSVPPDPVFGTLQPLKTIPPTQLPTYKQIGRAVGYELRVLGVNREQRKGDHIYSNSAAYKKVTWGCYQNLSTCQYSSHKRGSD